MIELSLNKKLKSSSGDMFLDVKFGVEKGKLLTLYGKSGAGKTSLLKIIAGLLKPEKGFIKVDRNSVDPILMNKNGNDQLLDFDAILGRGYELEASHVMECLDNNLIESPILPNSFSLDLMEILDAVRKETNIIFPKHD